MAGSRCTLAVGAVWHRPGLAHRVGGGTGAIASGDINITSSCHLDRTSFFGPVVMRVLVGCRSAAAGVFVGCLVVQGLVWSVVVVLEPPVVEERLRFEEAVEAFQLEQLSSQVAVEGFDEGILPGMRR